jgi:hypothetical protein
LNSELDDYELTIDAELEAKNQKAAVVVAPQCDIYTLMAYRLSGEKLADMKQIFEMLEADVYMALYLRRIDDVNREYPKL